MKILTPLGALFWIALIIFGLPLLKIIIAVARARTGLRSIEKTHITDPENNYHEDCDLSRCPAELKKLVADTMPAARQCGFTDLLTGRRMRLKAGRANTYYHILTAPNGDATAEFTHVRVARVVALWPIHLPFSNLIGPVTCLYAFETLFSDQVTLITCTNPAILALKMPSIRVNLMPADATFADRWRSHQEWIETLKVEGPRQAVKLTDKSSYFEKGVIQRRQIAVDQQKRMRELREKSRADVWDNKPV